jgi:hypothetical protein
MDITVPHCNVHEFDDDDTLKCMGLSAVEHTDLRHLDVRECVAALRCMSRFEGVNTAAFSFDTSMVVQKLESCDDKMMSCAIVGLSMEMNDMPHSVGVALEYAVDMGSTQRIVDAISFAPYRHIQDMASHLVMHYVGVPGV